VNLPLSKSRCAGRFGLGPDDPVCPRRQQCARYLAMLGPDAEQFPGGYLGFISVHTGMCRHGDDYMIKVIE
jgi:hypothetical protein